MPSEPADESETIAAIATGNGAAGIGIVRLSGPDAFAVIDRLRRDGRRTHRQPGQTLRRATLHDPDTGEPLDDVLLAVFHCPRSFTGENLVEIQAHGGRLIIKRLFAACIAAAARPARPGEFSERAFTNGKLDLAQAEAVADLIAAETIGAQRAAQLQLTGALSAAVRGAIEPLRKVIAAVEASIDFPEEVGEIDRREVDAQLERAAAAVAALLSTAGYGRRLQEGARVVLTGRPNVGKSSLLNALTGTERAIVTAIPGTTRDILEEALQIQGIPIRAIDTAGIRPSDDPVEQIGIQRARAAVNAADAVILVLDSSTGLTAADQKILATLSWRKTVAALNKADRGDASAARAALKQAFPELLAVETCAPTGAGLDALRHALGALLGAGATSGSDSLLVTSARHEAALRRAASALSTARETVAEDLPAELIAVDSHAALQALGEITGQTAREEIIAGIFAQFCIGK